MKSTKSGVATAGTLALLFFGPYNAEKLSDENAIILFETGRDAISGSARRASSRFAIVALNEDDASWRAKGKKTDRGCAWVAKKKTPERCAKKGAVAACATTCAPFALDTFRSCDAVAGARDAKWFGESSGGGGFEEFLLPADRRLDEDDSSRALKRAIVPETHSDGKTTIHHATPRHAARSFTRLASTESSPRIARSFVRSFVRQRVTTTRESVGPSVRLCVVGA